MRYNTARYELHIDRDNLPRGRFRAAFFTDMHNQADEAETRQVLEIFLQGKPDLVLCGGDMIIGKPGRSTEPAVRFLRTLSSRYPVWMGTGNHEYRTRIYPEQYGSMYRDYRAALKDADVRFLENRKAEIHVCGIPVELAGFDMDRRHYSRFKQIPLPVSEIRKQLGEPDPSKVSILLAHNPSGMEAYFAWGADLTLCGHYHGGIVRFGKHSGLIGPNLRPFPSNAYGLFQRNGKSVIVSSGCGEHTVPVRIRNPREIVFIDILVNESW